MRPRDHVYAFAQAMERELRANDHKGGWESDSVSRLMRRLKQETEELKRAISAPSDTAARKEWRARILSEAADVANFAMMVADVCGALEVEQ